MPCARGPLPDPLDARLGESSIAPAVAATAVATGATTAAVAAATSPARDVVVARTDARLARPGLVDRQPTTLILLVVQPVDGRLRVGRADHLHEAEAPAATRLTV